MIFLAGKSCFTQKLEHRCKIQCHRNKGDKIYATSDEGLYVFKTNQQESPTYAITPTVSSSNEGGEIRTNVTTTRVDAGTRLIGPLVEPALTLMISPPVISKAHALFNLMARSPLLTPRQ